MAEEHDVAAPSGPGADGRIADAAAARLRDWRAALRERREALPEASPRELDVLGGVSRDRDGLAFTQRVLDLLASTGDPFASALGLREVTAELPDSLPRRDRIAVRAGGIASLGLPWAVLPIARRWLRDRVSHLALATRLPSETAKQGQLPELREALRARAAEGHDTLLALHGPPVLGPAAVATEADRLAGLAAEPEVTHLAVDPARLAPGTSWSIAADAESAAAALRPVLEAARDHGVRVVLEPRDLRGALLMPEVLIRSLAGPGLDRALVGAVLPAELPESREICEQLLRWARQRRGEGGAAPEFTVGVAGIGAGERIASITSGLADPTLASRTAQQAQSLRLLRLLLDGAEAATGDRDGSPAAAAAAAAGADAAPPICGVVLASEDPSTVAAALELARRAGRRIGVQLRAGVAPDLARLFAEDGSVPSVRLRLPLAARREFSALVEPLVVLAAEAADPELTDPALTDPGAGGLEAGEVDAEDRDRLLTLLEAARAPFPASQRTQRRAREWDPSERDSALFYRAPADPERFDTGGLTAAVLGLNRGSTGAFAPTGAIGAASGTPGMADTAAGAAIEARSTELRIPAISASGFANEPDTDSSRAENRDWVLGLLERAVRSDAGAEGAIAAREASTDADTLVRTACAAADSWRAQRAADRSVRLRRLALGTAAARDRLIEVLAAESGAPVSVLDAQVNGTIDAARYLGGLAEGLGAVRGAEFRPERLALVVADAGQPLLARAEALLAVLASGSAAILLAHPSVARSSAVLIEEWEAAGLPRGVVVLAVAPAPDPAALHLAFAADLAGHREIERALVLGARSTGLALVQRRPDLRVEGHFQARASLLVTAAADPAAAAGTIIASVFGAGAVDPARVSQLLLLGGGGWRRRLLAQLADGVAGIRAGSTAAGNTAAGSTAADSASAAGAEPPLALTWGPLPEPPSAAGLRALTELAPGEAWLVEPRRLDEAGLLWSPGVRTGVKRDAGFWEDAVGMPVLGVARVRSLGEGIALQNAPGGGGFAGLLSLDAAEVLPWLEGVDAAVLTVNTPTTGARIERRPVGGWDAAGMGMQPLAGGPNRLVTLGSWELREGTPSATLHLRGLEPEIQVLIETAQTFLAYQSFDRLRRAALADALTWRTQLGVARDTAGLGIERNLLRHRPVPVQLRLAEGGSVAELIRVLAAGLLVRAPLTVSTGEVLPASITAFLAGQGVPVSLERDTAWLERLAVAGPERLGELTAGVGSDTADEAGIGTGAAGFADRARGEQDPQLVLGDPGAAVARIRLIGGDAVRSAEWLGGLARVALWAEPVTMAGPVELLTFVREQAVSVREHRFGLLAPVDGLDEWIDSLAP